MPHISVIIPVYNAGNYIVDTLNSVLQQTLKDIEVIVVNDGSNDQSLAECYRLQEIDKRIIIINQDNQGVSKARNVGKQNATGDYIIFIDADDELDCRMLEILYTQARKTDSDISVCGVDRIFEKKQEEKKQYHCNYEEITVDQAIEWLLLGQKIESGAWNKLFKASTIEDVHFEEGKKINEDKYFVFRSLLKSKKIVYCAEKLYYYYCRENSVTNQSFSERWFDSLYFADRIYEELKGRNNLEVFARYQLLIAYYTVLRRMYPFRNQYKKEYQLVIDKIKSTSFKSVLSYMDKKQVFGDMSVGRVDVWLKAFSMFDNHSLVGIGWGQYVNQGGWFWNIHNIYIQLLVETGIIGFIIYCGWFLFHLVRTWSIYSKMRVNPEDYTNIDYCLMNFSLAMQIFFILYGFTGNPLYDREMFVPYFIACAISVNYANNDDGSELE